MPRSVILLKEGGDTDRDRSTSARTPNALLHPTTDHTLPVPRFTHLVSDPDVEEPWISSGKSLDIGVWKWTDDRHVSFVDCPGHDILMATMLTGAAVSMSSLHSAFQ